MAALTDPAIRKAKPGTGRRDLPDGTVSGLALRIGTDGTKAWSVRYRVAGRQRRLSLGTFPEVGLKDARQAARKAINTASLTGADPAELKKQRRTADTFGSLCTAYTKATTAKRSASEDSRIIKAELLPVLEHRKLAEITRRDVRELLDKIAERPAPIMANRVWALINRMFNFAIEQDYPLQGNPASRIAKRPEATRERVLTDDEIRELWAALEDAKRLKRVTEDAKGPAIPAMIARSLQVQLLCGQRPGEVARMRWQDLELTEGAAWWTIPAEFSKNKEPHRVPLTARIVALLAEAKAAAPKDGGKWVFAGIAGASIAARSKKAVAELKHAGAVTFDCHRHDLRRTAATRMAEAGIARDTISHVLNHVDRGSRATAVYERFSHDPEKRVALDMWDRRFAAILAATATDNVLAFVRA